MVDIAKLRKFAKKIIKICKRAGTTPILYGSLAYVHYTKDKKYKINDIDFYIPEKYFKKIIELLKKEKIEREYSEEWHTLQISYGKLKVELDSLEFWYKGHDDFKDFDFEGEKIKILSLNDLKTMYKIAAEKSDLKDKNGKKYKELLCIQY